MLGDTLILYFQDLNILFLVKKCMIFAKFLAAIVIISLLQSCTSPTNISPVINKEDFYGNWLLSNPKNLQKDLIFGVLFICDNAERESGICVCEDNDFMMLLLEKNFGHGCTDYVCAGNLEFNRSDKYWYLVVANDLGKGTEKMKITLTGKSLHVFQDSDKKAVFKRSTRKIIDKKFTCPRH